MIRAPSSLSRRQLLGAMLLPAAHAAAAAVPPVPPVPPVPRIAALDWVSAQNLMALGITPLAMPEIDNYRRLVVAPDPGPAVRELGLREESNFELLATLKPALQVYSAEMSLPLAKFEKISPTLRFDTNPPAGQADLWQAGFDAMLRLGGALGLATAAQAYAQACSDELAQGRERLLGYDGRPVFLATVLDGRRMLLFGRGSLFQSVLDHYGVANAWDGPTSRFGHLTVSVDQLLRQPDARLLVIGNTRPAQLARTLRAPVIASLPFARAGRLTVLPNVLFYGGLPPARRFARLAADALALAPVPHGPAASGKTRP